MPGNFDNLRNFILAQSQLDRGSGFREGEVYNTPTQQMSPSYGSNRRKMTPYEIESQKRDRRLFDNSPKATQQDLNEFGLDSQGRRTAPRSREQMFMDMEQYGAPPTNDLRQLTPRGIQELQKQQQMQELSRVLQQQQQQPRSYTRPFEAPTQNQLNNYKQNHPMNRMWDEMKNYR